MSRIDIVLIFITIGPDFIPISTRQQKQAQRDFGDYW